MNLLQRLFGCNSRLKNARVSAPTRSSVGGEGLVVRIYLIDRRFRRGLEIGAARADADPVFASRREIDSLDLRRSHAAAAPEEL